MAGIDDGEDFLKLLARGKDFTTLYLKATEDNMKRVNELRLKITPKSTLRFTKKRLSDLNRRGDILIVATALPTFPVEALHDRIIGMGMLLVMDNISERFGVIHTMVVHDLAEGRGVGTEILRVLVALGKERELSYIDLTSNKSRKRALRMYGKAGFKNIRKNYFRLTLSKR